MEQKKQYKNGEKVIFFSEKLAKAKADVKKYEALVQRFAALPADEYSSQNWNGKLQQQLDLEALRQAIRDELLIAKIGPGDGPNGEWVHSKPKKSGA